VQFKNSEEELRYISVEIRLLEKAARGVINQPIDEPSKEAFWSGPRDFSDFPSQARVRNEDVEQQWNAQKESINKAQTKLSKLKKPVIQNARAAMFEREEDANEAAEEMRAKRKRGHDDDGGRPPKFRSQDKALLHQGVSEAATIAALVELHVAERKKTIEKSERRKFQVDRMVHKNPKLKVAKAERRLITNE
jgi:hypothetical protein